MGRSNKQLSAVAEQANSGKCNKKISKTDYRVLFSGGCHKLNCNDCIGFQKGHLKEMAKLNNSWQCMKCSKNKRRSIFQEIS